jgi:trehalose 6-phosphate synthase/phosphatase
LSEAAALRAELPAAKPGDLPVPETVSAYQQARRRCLLLDYDGTLVTYTKRPKDAAPKADVLELLARLAAQPANTVAVISGRSRADIEGWLGGVEGLWLAAEHGATIRSPATKSWETYRADYGQDWKERVMPVLEHYCDRTPGSLIEEKEFALVWHYRMADPVFGAWLANELVSTLEQLVAETELRAFHGQKIVEVKPVWATKGEVVARLASYPEPDFCLAAGDDRTDEDLFARLPDNAWTILIGDKGSRARYCLADPKGLHQLLNRFVEADER